MEDKLQRYLTDPQSLNLVSKFFNLYAIFTMLKNSSQFNFDSKKFRLSLLKIQNTAICQIVEFKLKKNTYTEIEIAQPSASMN